MKYDFFKSDISQILRAGQTMSHFQKTLSIYSSVSSCFKETKANLFTKSPIFLSSITKQPIKSFNIATLNASNQVIKSLSTNIASTLTSPAFPSVSQFHEVQRLIGTINSFRLDESIFPSGAVTDINNANIHTDTVDISENLANNITAVLKENDIFIKDSTPPSRKTKTISIATFKKYLEILVTVLTIASFVYTIGHDYLSDKSNAKYQSQMLKEEQKQTELLQSINDKLSKNTSTTSTEKH